MNDISIVLGGEAGQGIQTVEYILTHVLKNAGYNVFSTQEFMSRIRGGSNSTQIRVSSRNVSAPVDRIDLFLPLDADAIPHMLKRITPATVIIGEKAKLKSEQPIIDTPFSRYAEEAGGKIYANVVAAGVILGLFSLDQKIIEDFLKKQFSRKGDAVVENNFKAVRKGQELGRELIKNGTVAHAISPDEKVSSDILVDGGEAISLGALAGGCNFLS